MRTAAAALALALSAGAAAAEDAKDCAAMADDAKRLICYDLIFKVKQTQTTESRWSVDEEASRLDDRKNVFVYLQSNEPLPGRFGNKERGRIVFACREGKTALFISFGGHFMSSLGGGGTITYRVDKRPAAKKPMTASTDHQSLGLWSAGDAMPFAKELYGASSLYIQATPHSESPVSAEFAVAGLEQAIKPLQAACKWPAAAPKPPGPTSLAPRQ